MYIYIDTFFFFFLFKKITSIESLNTLTKIESIGAAIDNCPNESIIITSTKVLTLPNFEFIATNEQEEEEEKKKIEEETQPETKRLKLQKDDQMNFKIPSLVSSPTMRREEIEMLGSSFSKNVID